MMHYFEQRTNQQCATKAIVRWPVIKCHMKKKNVYHPDDIIIHWGELCRPDDILIRQSGQYSNSSRRYSNSSGRYINSSRWYTNSSERNINLSLRHTKSSRRINAWSYTIDTNKRLLWFILCFGEPELNVSPKPLSLHEWMRPKFRAREEIRNLFYKCSHEKVLVRKHARSEAPLGERCAMICNRSCDMSYVVVRSLCNKSECCTMRRQHRTNGQVVGRWNVR